MIKENEDSSQEEKEENESSSISDLDEKSVHSNSDNIINKNTDSNKQKKSNKNINNNNDKTEKSNEINNNQNDNDNNNKNDINDDEVVIPSLTDNNKNKFEQIHESTFGLNIGNNQEDNSNNNNDNNNKNKDKEEDEEALKKKQEEEEENKLKQKKEVDTKKKKGQEQKNKSKQKEEEENQRLIVEQKKKEEEEKRTKKIIQTFIKLKKTLLQVCIDIEENLNKVYYPENTESIANFSHIGFTCTSSSSNENFHSSPSKNFLAPHKKTVNSNSEFVKRQKKQSKMIKDYQYRIVDTQSQLDIVLKMNGVEELEGVLESKKQLLDKLKNETISLMNVKEIQNKGKEEYEQGALKRQALIAVNEKINKIKEETRLKKDYCKMLCDKIHLQEKNINEIKSKCDLIKSNIKYYKKIKTDELKKEKNKLIPININNNNKSNININNYNSDNEDNKNNLKKNFYSINNNINNNLYNINKTSTTEENIDLDILKKENQENIEKIKAKKLNLKMQIKEQGSIILSLTKDIEALSLHLSSIKDNLRNNFDKISTIQYNIKKKESEFLKKLNPIKEKESIENRSPWYIGPVKNEKKKMLKPFDHIKFMKDYEKSLNERTLKPKVNLSSEIEGNKKNKNLEEIENLKNDIKNTIKSYELDPKMEKIINELKYANDPLAKYLNRNDALGNFYVTEGANLQIGASYQYPL